MNWKLHKVVKQTAVCAREQELLKKDEPVGQIAVRFVTEQVSRPLSQFCRVNGAELIRRVVENRVWKSVIREVESLELDLTIHLNK